jgi:serine/threonine protein kinase
MSSDAQPAAESSGRLSSGSQLDGGKYRVDALARSTTLAEVYDATRTEDNTPVSIHLLDPRLVGANGAAAAIGSAVDAAKSLSHKNVATTLELATEAAGVFVVTELLEGHTLRELLERKKETGGAGFSPKGANNILSHLCNALGEIHEATAHGAITLDHIYVNKAGRVKLTGFGLWPLAAAAAATGVIKAGIAPEVAGGTAPAAAADLFSAGAILYEILVGLPPIKGCPRPSQALPATAPEVDMVVGRSMAPEIAKRPNDAVQLKKAIAKALTSRPSQERAATPAPVIKRATVPPGQSLAASLSARPSMEQPAVGSEEDLESAIDDEEENWLISKGKLDYGPFTLKGVVDQIKSNGILPGSWIIDKDTGDRVLVEDHPLLTDIVAAAKEKRDEMRRANAEVIHAKSERRRGTTLYAFIAAGVLALGGGVYALVSALSSDDGHKSAGVSALEEGSLQAKFNFPTKEEIARKRRARRKGGKSSGGAKGGWDDSLDLDMAGAGGGSERLDNSQINPVIARHGGKLGRCLSKTGERHADIDFIIAGSGKVTQVRVNGKTNTPLSNCVRGAMKSMKFPSFDGPRTKANFNMSL